MDLPVRWNRLFMFASGPDEDRTGPSCADTGRRIEGNNVIHDAGQDLSMSGHLLLPNATLPQRESMRGSSIASNSSNSEVRVPSRGTVIPCFIRVNPSISQVCPEVSQVTR